MKWAIHPNTITLASMPGISIFGSPIIGAPTVTTMVMATIPCTFRGIELTISHPAIYGIHN